MTKLLERLAIVWITVAAFLLSGCGSALTSGRNTSDISKNAVPEHVGYR